MLYKGILSAKDCYHCLKGNVVTMCGRWIDGMILSPSSLRLRSA